MANWKEPGDGEYTRILDDGTVAKVFEQPLMWRAAVDDRMVDDIFFEAHAAMKAIDAWEAGDGDLTFHPVERRWFGDDRKGYGANQRDFSGSFTTPQGFGTGNLTGPVTGSFYGPNAEELSGVFVLNWAGGTIAQYVVSFGAKRQ